MPTAKTSSSKPAFLAFWLALAAVLPARAGAPAADKLLDKVLAPPDLTYSGRTMVTQWFGKQARAEEVDVLIATGGRARRRFLAPDGRVLRVVVSDGETEQVYVPRLHKIYAGDAARTYEKIMPAEKERDLLVENYDLAVSGPETVAGRPTWILQLTPKTPGKPSQRLWVDQQTGVVLENKRFLPERSFAAMSRFVTFQPGAAAAQDDFKVVDASASVMHPAGLEPAFLSLEELNAATGRAANFPEKLPGGFHFESADYMTVGRHSVREIRYTDGLAIVSIFLTDRPVQLPKQGTTFVSTPAQGMSALRLSASGKVLNWRRGREYFTAMGDVSRELLLAISGSFK